MNKKLALLLIPLMLMPLAAFGYAHWTDSAKKNYYLHAGTVKTEIIWWHIEGTNTYDVDCDGVIYGDEIQILPVEEYDADLDEWEVVKLDIVVDPIYPSWFLDLEVIIHNKGRLAVKADEPILEWTLNNLTMPDKYMNATTGIPLFFQYEWHYYIWVADTWVEVEPTTMVVKPCEVLRVKEFIHFIGQDFPELQCNWLDLHVEIPVFHYTGDIWFSEPMGPFNATEYFGP